MVTARILAHYSCWCILYLFLSTYVQGYTELSPKGPCRGPGGVNDKVNSRHAGEHTRDMCEDACTALLDCVGYAYCSICNDGECILYGSGLDGTCSDPSALSEVACEGLGTCSNPAQLTEDDCGTCSEPTALSKTLCTVVGGVWTSDTWTSAGAVWEDAEDPWTGDSHYSTVIEGTTNEASSDYICVDADPEDHMADCIGDDISCSFDGFAEEDRVEANCTATPPENCVFIPAPTGPSSKPPHSGDIRLPGWNVAMSGACRSGSDFTDKVNGKYSNTAGADGALTQLECAAECLAELTCIGYAHSTAWCIVYGPEIHLTPGTNWVSDNHEAVTITGTKTNPSYICVTGPPRGGDTDETGDESGGSDTDNNESGGSNIVNKDESGGKQLNSSMNVALVLGMAVFFFSSNHH